MLEPLGIVRIGKKIIMEMMSNSMVVKTPVGRIAIRVSDGRLSGIDFLITVVPEQAMPKDPMAREVLRQLTAYFRDPQRPFRLPLEMGGTEFQRRVWRALIQIPPGQVRSYGAVARQLESGPRAVGNACRCNPIPIVVPCHRVVSCRGMGGYAGETGGEKLQIKRWLLSHEGVAL